MTRTTRKRKKKSTTTKRAKKTTPKIQKQEIDLDQQLNIVAKSYPFRLKSKDVASRKLKLSVSSKIESYVEDYIHNLHYDEEKREVFGRVVSTNIVEVFSINPIHGELTRALENRARVFVAFDENNKKVLSCSCIPYLSNQLNCCSHTAAAERLFKEHKLFQNKIKSFSKSKKTIDFNSKTFEVILLGFSSNDDISKYGLTKTTDNFAKISSLKKFLDAAKNKDITFTSATKNYVKDVVQKYKIKKRGTEISKYLENSQIEIDCLKHSLYPYQKKGSTHLVETGRAILGDQMGLGKTPQTIAACEAINSFKLQDKGTEAKVLLVVLSSLKKQWAKEIDKFSKSPSSTVLSSGRDIKTYAEQKHEDISKYTIINYELLQRHIDLFKKMDFDVLVLDEAQKIKNDQSKTWSAIQKIKFKSCFFLSGTLIENNLDDLYSIISILDPFVLGPKWKFDFDFKNLTSMRGNFAGYKNQDKLKNLIKSIYLGRTKEVVMKDLPKFDEIPIELDMPFLQRDFHDYYIKNLERFKADLWQKQNQMGSNKALGILSGIRLKIRQVCNDIKLADPKRKTDTKRPKIDFLLDLLYEKAVQEKEKILIFSEWREMQYIIIDFLKKMKINYMVLNSTDVPTKKRGEFFDEFENSKDIKVLLSTDAGGTGVNLQYIKYIVHIDIHQNPAKVDQRNGRVHRIGQKRDVTCWYLFMKDSFEDIIRADHIEKRKLRSGVLYDEGS